jgi:hypothetical protein
VKLEKARSERAVADVAVAASEDDASKAVTPNLGQLECAKRNVESVRGWKRAILKSFLALALPKPARLTRFQPLLRPMQGLCAAVGEIPSFRKWLKIAISSFARASERLSKLRNIRYRELAMPHHPLLPHPHLGSNHQLNHQITHRSWIPDILSISRAFTCWENPARTFKHAMLP